MPIAALPAVFGAVSALGGATQVINNGPEALNKLLPGEDGPTGG